jgi:hypothetical protein
MTTALARPLRLSLETFARSAGLHPELVTRLVRLGLLDAARDVDATIWFRPAQLDRAARIERLRTAFSLNYAALGLVLDLLDRIEVLETELRHRPRVTRGDHSAWT